MANDDGSVDDAMSGRHHPLVRNEEGRAEHVHRIDTNEPWELVRHYLIASQGRIGDASTVLSVFILKTTDF